MKLRLNAHAKSQRLVILTARILRPKDLNYRVLSRITPCEA